MECRKWKQGVDWKNTNKVDNIKWSVLRIWWWQRKVQNKLWWWELHRRWSEVERVTGFAMSLFEASQVSWKCYIFIFIIIVAQFVQFCTIIVIIFILIDVEEHIILSAEGRLNMIEYLIVSINSNNSDIIDKLTWANMSSRVRNGMTRAFVTTDNVLELENNNDWNLCLEFNYQQHIISWFFQPYISEIKHIIKYQLCFVEKN